MIDNAYKINRGDKSVNFIDVPKQWYTESVYDLASNRIINGYTDGTFKPDNHVSRAEFSVMLAYTINPDFRPIEAKPELPPKNVEGPEASNQEFINQVIKLTNEQRLKNGLSPLQEYKELSSVAQLKSEDMRKKNYFDHTSPTYGSPFEMMKSFGITYRSAGENIAYGYRTPENVVNGWMNSPGHRANILDSSFTHIGIGFDPQGYYWTQMFVGR